MDILYGLNFIKASMVAIFSHGSTRKGVVIDTRLESDTFTIYWKPEGGSVERVVLPEVRREKHVLQGWFATLSDGELIKLEDVEWAVHAASCDRQTRRLWPLNPRVIRYELSIVQ